MFETLLLIGVFGVLAWLADRWTEWARRHQHPTCTVVACADPDCSCRPRVTERPAHAASPDEIAEARERRARHEADLERATGGRR